MLPTVVWSQCYLKWICSLSFPEFFILTYFLFGWIGFQDKVFICKKDQWMLYFLCFWILDDIFLLLSYSKDNMTGDSALGWPFLALKLSRCKSMIIAGVDGQCPQQWPLKPLNWEVVAPHSSLVPLLRGITYWGLPLACSDLLKPIAALQPTRSSAVSSYLSALHQAQSPVFPQNNSGSRSSFLSHCPSSTSRELWWLFSLLSTLFPLGLEGTEP